MMKLIILILLTSLAVNANNSTKQAEFAKCCTAIKGTIDKKGYCDLSNAVFKGSINDHLKFEIKNEKIKEKK